MRATRLLVQVASRRQSGPCRTVLTRLSPPNAGRWQSTSTSVKENQLPQSLDGLHLGATTSRDPISDAPDVIENDRSSTLEQSDQDSPLHVTQAGEHDRLPRSLDGLDISNERSQSPNSRSQQSESVPPTTSSYDMFIPDVPLESNALFARDACPCHLCVNPSSKQKTFSTVDIPSNIEVRNRERTDAGWTLTWTNDIPGVSSEHTSFYSGEYLESLAARSKLDIASAQFPVQHYWDKKDIESHLPLYDYQEYTTDSRVLLSALQALRRYGLVFVQNVPESENSVVEIANRIGPLKNTFYGSTWDVRSVPEAKNVAYTSGHLGFHMDLLYMKQPPRLQLLHCIRSSAKGGASLFTDAYRAAKKMLVAHEKQFSTLTKQRINYHYHNDGHHYTASRPVISAQSYRDISTEPEISAVHWSPPFQAPFKANMAASGKIQKWHAAATEFRNLVEDKDAVYERQMKPGECVIFDNQRILHARTAFEVSDAGKERWLKGCYLDSDPWYSKLRVLEAEYGSEKIDLKPASISKKPEGLIKYIESSSDPEPESKPKPKSKSRPKSKTEPSPVFKQKARTVINMLDPSAIARSS